MILLGINGGFSVTDCAELPIQAVDLARQLIECERPKTAVQRIVPSGIDRARQFDLNSPRPKPRKPEYEKLVILTIFGNAWKQDEIIHGENDAITRIGRHSAITREFGKLLCRLNMYRTGWCLMHFGIRFEHRTTRRRIGMSFIGSCGTRFRQ